MSRGVKRVTVWGAADEATLLAHSKSLADCIQEFLATSATHSIDWNAVSALMSKKMEGQQQKQWSPKVCRRLWDSIAYGLPFDEASAGAETVCELSDGYLQPYRAIRRFNLTADIKLGRQFLEPLGEDDEGGGAPKGSKLRKIVSAGDQGKAEIFASADLADGIASFSRPRTVVRASRSLASASANSGVAKGPLLTAAASFGNPSHDKHRERGKKSW